MDLMWIALVLGIIEGLTEFLPVSSTGHLIIVGHALGFKGEKAESFEIFIQLGAILAVALLYHRRFLGLLHHDGPNSKLSGRAGVIRFIVACAPACLLGAIFHGFIKHTLFNPSTVACGFIVGGAIILLLEFRPRMAVTTTLDQLTIVQALMIGAFQCLSLWPGMSRAGSTIIGGLVVGCTRSVAAEFSFLVAVPIMVAATGYDLLKSLPHLNGDDIPLFATGFIVALLSALVAVRIFVAFVARFSLVPFAIYRIIFGALLLSAGTRELGF